MNEAQFLKATRNVIRLEDLSADTVRKILPQLKAVFAQISSMIVGLPEESILREMQYRQMQQRIASILLPVNEQLRAELIQALGSEVENQTRWARTYLEAAEGIPEQRVAAVLPQPGVASTGAIPGAEITRTQLLALADDTKVLGKRLDQIFAVTTESGGVGPWLKDNIKLVDRAVKTGFLTGQTNEEIAGAIQAAGNLSAARSRAIARTAVMDMSQRAHNRFWDANRSVIAGYEYDATFDYRVCEQCAPWSGAIRRHRNDLPQVPIHPNCRCRVLPITATEWALRKEGPRNASFVDLVPAERVMRDKDGKVLKTAGGKWRFEKVPKPRAREGERFYAKPVTVNGKRYWRKAVDVKASTPGPYQMADFLRNASRETKVQVMGEERARRFERLYSRKDRRGRYEMTSQEALLRVLPRKS